MIENRLVITIRGKSAENFFNSAPLAAVRNQLALDYALDPSDIDIKYEPMLK